MNRVQRTQYTELKEKVTRSPQEDALIAAFDGVIEAEKNGAQPALTEAQRVLENAQEAVSAETPTTV